MYLEELLEELQGSHYKQKELLSFLLKEKERNIAITDSKGSLLFVGKDVIDQFGLREEFIGKSLLECLKSYQTIFSTEDLPLFIEKKLRDNSQEDFDFKDPKQGTTRISYFHMGDIKFHSLWIFRNLTWSEQPIALNNVLEEADIILQSVDEQGYFTYVNKAWKRILGYPEEVIISLNILEIVKPNEVEHCRQLLEQIAANQKDSEKIEISLRAYSGEEVVLAGTVSAEENPITGHKETRSLLYNITRRRHAEKALQESEANFRFLAENIEQVLFLRTDEQFLYVSPSFENLFGGSVEELYENWHNYYNYIHPEDRPRVVPFVRSSYDSRGYEQQYRILHKKGFVRWVWVKAFTFKVNEEALNRTVGIIIDITNQKYAEERLQKAKAVLEKSLTEEQKTKEKLVHANNDLKRAQSQLVHSEKMASLGTLTAGIAHEINNPINFVINGSIALENYVNRIMLILDAFDNIREDDLTPSGKEKWTELQERKQKHHYQHLRENLKGLVSDVRIGADRTVHIVKGLRNFARTDEEEIKRADIHEGLESTLTLINHLIKDKVEIIKSYKLDPPIIRCYPGQLNQVFMNLLTNAVQAFDGKGGKIEINTYQHAEKAVIEIADNGKGIPEKIREKIFEPFFTTKEVGEGTGMGLAISYAIIQSHKGQIKVHSSPANGTKFIIQIPINLT